MASEHLKTPSAPFSGEEPWLPQPPAHITPWADPSPLLYPQPCCRVPKHSALDLPTMALAFSSVFRQKKKREK